MKGRHHIVLETKRLKYEFDIRRNITVILGNSASGKTTLIEALAEYGRLSERGGIRLESDVACVVFSGSSNNWKTFIGGIKESIIFIDEDFSFVFSDEFARFVSESSNYYVIVTRRPLYNLPYSVNEIYGIRTTGKFNFPEKVYHEFYHIYDSMPYTNEDSYTFLLEDSKSGFDFYRNVFGDKLCKSSGGNANVSKILEEYTGNVAVIADGAAFGAYMNDLMSVADEKENVIIYLPESFEWLVLKSGIVRGEKLEEILQTPEDYIESSEYFSWERFFTALLIHCTENDEIKKYSKIKLVPFYYTGKNREAILSIMPEEIRRLAEKGSDIRC